MELAMCRCFFLLTSVLTALIALGACGPRPLSATSTGLPFQPGRYVQESYFAPGFKPDEVSYALTAFTVAPGADVSAEAFLNIFQDELVRAWQAQGLKLGQGENVCRLTGTIQDLAVKGTRLRWLTGRQNASLTISGAISHSDQVLFAFRDQVSVSSPLAPGPAAPREQELLLRQLARETINHMLNELLLHGATVDSPRSAMTRR